MLPATLLMLVVLGVCVALLVGQDSDTKGIGLMLAALADFALMYFFTNLQNSVLQNT